MRLSLLLMLIASSLCSWAQSPAPASNATDTPKVTVYIYRYKQFVGGALEPPVFCDEVQLAKMDNGRYFSVKLDPGQHAFHSNDKQSGVQMDLKAGQTYFLRVEIATGFAKGHGRIVLMSPEQGSYELKSSKLKPLDPGKVMDKARVSVEEAQFDSPTPAAVAKPAAVVPVSQPQPQSNRAAAEEHPIHGETVNDPDNAMGTTSQAGEQVSLGEAARRARQKKQPPQ